MLVSTVNTPRKKIYEAQEKEEEETFQLSLIGISEVMTSSDKNWYETILLDDTVETPIKIDTGAEANIIPRSVFDMLQAVTQSQLEPTNVRLEMFGGFIIKPDGVINLKMNLNGICIHDKFYVVNKSKCKPILGCQACRKFQLIPSIDYNSVSHVLSLQEFISRNKDVFTGLGCFPDYSLWRAIKPLKRPILHCPPLINTEGQWIRDNQSKANVFAEYLANIFSPNEPGPNAEPLLDIPYQEEEYCIPNTTVREVQKTIKDEINPKKAPGYDLITGQVLKELPRKACVKITQIINAAFRLQYVPQIWKVAEVIMIQKPGQKPEDLKSYRPISLLPVISKLFEKLLYKRLTCIITAKKLIPDHQFGFRSKHSTIEQVHRLVDQIEKTLEEKKVCSAVFLDVTKAFDKVWHEGLKHKLKRFLPRKMANILSSYLSERYFRIKQEDSYSELMDINAGVPQGSVLGPVLYLLYTSDMPEEERNTTATFADDTAFLTIGHTTAEAASELNRTLSKFERWTIQWRIKLNETKSVHVDFTYRNQPYVPVYINNQVIPFSNQAKYLGMTLDAKLKWKEHVKKKRQQLDLKYNQMRWLMGRSSPLPIENKILLYNMVLKPIWTYGICLYGVTSASNRLIIERFQNKVLREMVNAPWYIRNDMLHRDLGVEYVKDAIQRFALAHQKRLQVHDNSEAVRLLDVKVAGRTQKVPLTPRDPQQPMESISIDLMGPYTRSRKGKKYLLTVNDLFSKWVEAYPLGTPSTQKIISALQTEWFSRFGYPNVILSDHGSQFTSNAWKKQCSEWNVKHHTSAIYSPHQTPVERANQNIKNKVRIGLLGQPHSHWDENLDKVLFFLRNSVNAATGRSPAQIIFGRNLRHPQDMIPMQDDSDQGDLESLSNEEKMENINSEVRTNRKKYHTRYQGDTSKQKPLQSGQVVLIRNNQLSNAAEGVTASLSPRWIGPYTIKEHLGASVYLCEKADNPRDVRKIDRSNMQLREK
ncbi:hypothetical protein WDU94_012171 [Cyamophila willieti]